MKSHRSKNSRGFTIIELLIATTVFSVVLLIFLTAIIRVSELFYKGVNLSNTQESARNIMQNITEDVKFYQQPIYTFPSKNYFCIGGHRYTYSLGTQYNIVTPGSYGVLQEKTACVDPTTAGYTPNTSTGQELLSPGMQLNKMNINCANNQCTIGVHVVFYGADNTVLKSPSKDPLGYKAPDAECTGLPNTTQSCATADFNGTVLQIF